jgi:hypothetical protein
MCGREDRREKRGLHVKRYRRNERGLGLRGAKAKEE